MCFSTEHTSFTDFSTPITTTWQFRTSNRSRASVGAGRGWRAQHPPSQWPAANTEWQSGAGRREALTGRSPAMAAMLGRERGPPHGAARREREEGLPSNQLAAAAARCGLAGGAALHCARVRRRRPNAGAAGAAVLQAGPVHAGRARRAPSLREARSAAHCGGCGLQPCCVQSRPPVPLVRMGVFQGGNGGCETIETGLGSWGRGSCYVISAFKRSYPCFELPVCLD